MAGIRPESDYDRQALVLRALANEARLMMIHRLDKGESCVCDLVELVGLDQSTVSRHLAVLKVAGVVDRERRGHHIYYRLIAPCVVDFVTCAAAIAAGQGAPTIPESEPLPCGDTSLPSGLPADGKEDQA